MYLTNLQTIGIILAIAAGTMITRFLPFILFPENKETPKIVTYLGIVLPPAMMGLLVIYCLRNTNLFSNAHGLPEILAILVIILLHHYKNNVLLSIAGGTLTYMFLIQMIFN
ncbi:MULTISPECIES: AzlD domain-containing protein [unclassified Enterococcus]|uniref:branched-chain amino acid transporter permease n=1 Tax=unclassified Enterococcus TaxID=2608891 RepID=UPI0015529FC4|nr:MULTISPECIES: AzlD domain-containing protein [unclassified Enterococcus]MBS7577039.1 AzlD domain-containing protein [Enterococcus sp. MMGLQ5-2]MBS7584514.1 AzlD domain-containing protein [Enterococcus sp. MMGLQ5-1]NPD12369.1 branched-chain amino acid transporter AzlD [Enterococcus sp. MMGLQ5-1]NPD36873.1 branched-chain amino acid transporter AzlD [Enterococcus sp. MMGLQ5-2]